MPQAVLDELRDLDDVLRIPPAGDDERAVRLVVAEAAKAIPRVTECLERHGFSAEAVREERPPFDDVFVRLVEDGTG